MSHRTPVRSVCLGSVSVAALLLAASTALAQDAPAAAPQDAIVLDTIVLTAASDASVQANGYVGNYTQAATKSDTPVAEQQQSVSVVTTAQIEDQGAETLGQALSYTAGIVGEPFGSDPRFDSPTLRGFNASDSQYLNGLRQLRKFGAVSYETYGLQQVEVLKGPSSALYGQGSPAGIINQVQKRAQDDNFAEAGVGFDSNSSKEVFFDVNRVASEQLNWRLTGILKDTQEQIDELTNKRGYLAGALRYKPTDTTTIDIITSYTKDSPITPPGVPYALTRTADGEDLRDLYAGEPGYDDSDRKSFNFGVEISQELAGGWTLQQGFRYEKFDWNYTSSYVSGLSDDGNFINVGLSGQDEESDGVNLDTRLAGEVTTGAVKHRLLFGLDIRQYDSRAQTRFAYGPQLDWRDPVYVDVNPTDFWYRSDVDTTLRQIGVYAQDELEFGNWRGTVAIRHDSAKQWGTDENNFAGLTDIDRTDNETTYRLGLGYQTSNGFMPYVNYSTSFDPEIGVDFEGDQLEPTTGKQWEIGVKYQPTAFDGLITAAVYDLRQENVTRFVTENGIPGNRQIGEVHSKGFELEATAAIADRWDVRGGYAYNDTEQVGGADDGKDLPNAPKHTASLWLSHDFQNGVRLGGGVRHLGQRFGDLANVYDLDSVTLVDVGASYTRGNLEGSLNVSNIGDEVYVATCGSFGCYYGEGRTVTAKLTTRF